jgi:flagellar hook capping protein FlgD
MIRDAGDGRAAGDGAYRKGAGGPTPHQGAVYVVAGSSGQTSGGPLSHPVMFASLNVLGSVVLDITGNRLEATFLNASGTVDDQFTMIKGAAVAVDPSPSLTGLHLSPAYPNPSSGKTNWSFSTPTSGLVRLRILDAAGRQVRLIVEHQVGAGEHEAEWDGRTDAGRQAGNGTYFGVLEFGGEVRTRKLVRRP